MKSIRLTAPGCLQLFEEPAPLPHPHETLLRVQAVGICGSDLLWYKQAGIGDARLSRPLVPGHEFMGVTNLGVRVAVDPAIPCGTCRYCRTGHPNLCPSVIFAGHGSRDGALQEQLAWNTGCLFPLPDSLSNEEGVMLEPLGVALHTVDLAHLKTGMSVAVLGCGPIGLLVLQLARLSGAAHILAADPLPHRLSAARDLGADQAVQGLDRASAAGLLAASRSDGMDVVFDASGSPGAVEAAFELAAPGARVILAGIPEDDRTTFCASLARRKGLTIKLVRRMKHTYPRAIEMVSKHRIDVKSLVSHRFPLEKSTEAFEAAVKRTGLKVIIQL